MIRTLILSGLLLAGLRTPAAEDRDSKVRNDLALVQSVGLWVYNDLDQGIAEARQTGKPLLVVLRCIP